MDVTVFSDITNVFKSINCDDCCQAFMWVALKLMLSLLFNKKTFLFYYNLKEELMGGKLNIIKTGDKTGRC